MTVCYLGSLHSVSMLWFFKSYNYQIHIAILYLISDSLLKASVKALDILTAMAVPVELFDRDSLMKSTNTSILAPRSYRS
ncbi:putative chaperonin ATPase [Medicago truncatula]|uniref:Putative chaperonin ATPase n=1 Tax=Medicago truncatula TaxID=3880 RepID=A0A396GRR0_MEDTR|nr:putative chaperonin ATPase [Medicago truncatula]